MADPNEQHDHDVPGDGPDVHGDEGAPAPATPGTTPWSPSVANEGNSAVSPSPGEPQPDPTPATADWSEDEARARLRLDKGNPAPGDGERMAHDRLVWDTERAFHDLSAFAMIKLVTLYANHRTRNLVDQEAKRLGIDPIGAHAVLATMPSLTHSEY